MANLNAAVAAAKGLRTHIDNLANEPGIDREKHDLTEDERKEALALRDETIGSVDSVIALIEQSLADRKSTFNGRTYKPKVTTFDRVGTDDPETALKNSTEQDLSSVSSVSQKMLDSIGQVMPNFNAILDLPGLDYFSATLESVPAVGIVGSQVKYVEKVLSGSVVNDTWHVLDTMPAQPAAGESTNLFSYNGVLYLSIGQTIYSKTPRDVGNPDLRKAATDNWANMFNPGWNNLSQCLPDANSRSVIPFSQVASSGSTLSSWLLKLGNDFSLSYSTDPVKAAMSFKSMTFNGSGSAPQLQKAAYWSNSIWGYDKGNILYELTPNFGGSSYVIKSKTTMTDAITDMTALGDGIVAARSDGKLWKRIVSPPPNPNDPKSKAFVQWVPYINQDSVTNLGAAAPGVILDFKTLTTYLKSNYIETQTDLLPVIQMILAWCGNHSQYLAQLLADSNTYANASDPAKKALAMADGQLALNNAMLWAKLLTTSINSANTTIVEMTRETSQIDNSIAAQLQQISGELNALKGTLATQQEVIDDLTATLMGCVSAVVVGIGIVILSFFAGPFAPLGFLAGGALIFGGMTFVFMTSQRLTDARRALEMTQQAITNLTTAQKQLTAISGGFINLTDEYGNLNSFWGMMYTDTQKITVTERLGITILEDPFSIKAAQAYTEDITTNLNAYLAILYAQGITNPDDALLAAVVPSHYHTMEPAVLNKHIDGHGLGKVAHKKLKMLTAIRIITYANKSLKKKDYKSYLSLLGKAVELNHLAHELYTAPF